MSGKIGLGEITDPSEKSRICAAILRSLPNWFGIESAIVEYEAAVATMPFLMACDDDMPVGFIATRETSPCATEVHVIAVLESHHGRGIGKRLIRWAAERASSEGKALLTVKTLAPSHPDEGYARTRRFYESAGFLPVEEIPGLWGPANPCLLMVMPLNPVPCAPLPMTATPLSAPMAVRIVHIAEEHAAGFRDALDSVARERRWLGHTEAPPIEKVVEYVRENIRKGEVHLVALDGERVVGWCDIVRHGKPAFRHGSRLGIGVVESHRGRGVGAALLSEALSRAKANGIVRVELDVYVDNERAIALYRRFGFVVEGRKVRSTLIDGRYIDDFLMAKLLD